MLTGNRVSPQDLPARYMHRATGCSHSLARCSHHLQISAVCIHSLQVKEGAKPQTSASSTLILFSGPRKLLNSLLFWRIIFMSWGWSFVWEGEGLPFRAAIWRQQQNKRRRDWKLVKWKKIARLLGLGNLRSPGDYKAHWANTVGNFFITGKGAGRACKAWLNFRSHTSGTRSRQDASFSPRDRRSFRTVSADPPTPNLIGWRRGQGERGHELGGAVSWIPKQAWSRGISSPSSPPAWA